MLHFGTFEFDDYKIGSSQNVMVILHLPVPHLWSQLSRSQNPQESGAGQYSKGHGFQCRCKMGGPDGLLGRMPGTEPFGKRIPSLTRQRIWTRCQSCQLVLKRTRRTRWEDHPIVSWTVPMVNHYPWMVGYHMAGCASQVRNWELNHDFGGSSSYLRGFSLPWLYISPAAHPSIGLSKLVTGRLF